ncbi:glycoprotein [Prochlorococcus sp. AH-716-M10]|nr:glycoprotein [Prochlorococcus sp. AH-716-M10]
MFLKDHLKDTYQKASFDNNHLMLENIINVWAHRFGPESLNQLFVKNQNQFKLTEEDQAEVSQNQINLELIEEDQAEANQNQINLELIEEDQAEANQNQINLELIEEDQAEANQNQINLELLKNVQYEEEIEFKPKETKTPNNTETIDKDIYGSYKNESEYKDTEELPLPNIKNLRKWINNEKKAS